MASYTRHDRITRTVVYSVPASYPFGANWVEVNKALVAAHNNFNSVYKRAPADNELRVIPKDDSIDIEFDTPVD